MMTMTTLNAIREKSPCHSGWKNLLDHLGKTAADDEPLLLLTVLDSNGLEDALWVLVNTGCDERLARHFGAWCAEQVLPIFEAEMPGDMRPRQAIALARDDDATPAARAAAGDAAWDAAGAATADAEGAAAWAATGDAAWAAWAATGAAAGAATGAAWAAWDAAGAARAAARAAQAAQFRKMITEVF
jgi:hypothetical protein